MARAKTTRGSKKKSPSKTKNRFYVVNAFQEARTNLTGRLEDDYRKYVTAPIESGKTFVKKEISSRLQAIPAAFDLPSKKDIDALTRQVKNLNTKVNKLSKTSAA